MTRLSEDELAAIYAALAMNIRGYDQVVEVSSTIRNGNERHQLMVALDLLTAIYRWGSTDSQWSPTPEPCHSGRCSDDTAYHWSISRKSPQS